MPGKKRVADEAVGSAPESQPVLHGIKKWIHEYDATRPRAAELQAEVDAYMAKFDAEQKRKEEEERAKHNVPDEDGFVTVRRVHRRGTNRAGDVTATAVAADAVKAPKSKKELQNFYTFQVKAKKAEALAEIRRQFEEDKRRVERMKAARRFKV